MKIKFLIALATLLVANFSFAQSSVWEISKGENKIYLGGTVHILRPNDHPLPKEFDAAYEKADMLTFETDVAAISDPSIGGKMMAKATYKDDKTLQTVLNKETYAKLEKLANELSLPIAQMQKIKPGMFSTMVMVVKMQKIGLTGEGVDRYFNKKAREEKKEIGQLETVDEQINFVTTMGDGYENEFVNKTLKEIDDLDTYLGKMIDNWKTGESDFLETVITEMKTDFPKNYQSILAERNNNWMPKIEAYFKDAKTEFVLVGALHLHGKDGLLTQLKAKGYTITQL